MHRGARGTLSLERIILASKGGLLQAERPKRVRDTEVRPKLELMTRAIPGPEFIKVLHYPSTLGYSLTAGLQLATSLRGGPTAKRMTRGEDYAA